MTKKIQHLLLGLTLSLMCISVIYYSIRPNPVYFYMTTTDSIFQNRYLTYEERENILTYAAIKPDTAQYPLGYVDSESKTLYYVKGYKTGDQIQSYNIRNQYEQQVCSSLKAVNDMVMINHKLYAIAKLQGESQMSCVEINPKDSSIKSLSPKKINIESFTYKKNENKLYFVGYDLEVQKTLNKAYESHNGSGTLSNAPSKLYAYSLESGLLNLIGESDAYWSQIATMNTQARLLVKLSEDVFTDQSFCYYNLKTHQLEESLSIPNLVRIDDYQYSQNDLYLFLLGVESTANYNPKDLSQSAPNNALYKFDLKTQTLERFLTFTDQYINNFQIVN